MSPTIQINSIVTIADIKRTNSNEQLLDFIMELELEIAEANFTEDLILKLATALASDSKSSTMIEIGNQISKMEGYEP